MAAVAVPHGVPARLVGLFLLLLAAAGFWLATPFAMARLAEVPGNEAAALVGRGVMVGDAGMARLEASRRAALGWTPRAQPHRELGLAAYAQAQDAQDPDRRAELLAQAARELRLAVTMAPIDPQALAMLATVEIGRGQTEPARDALITAQLVAPVSPEFALLRSWAAMKLWALLPEDARIAVQDDLMLAMRTRPRQLVQLARGAGQEELVREALSDEPALLERFEALLGETYIYPQPP